MNNRLNLPGTKPINVNYVFEMVLLNKTLAFDVMRHEFDLIIIDLDRWSSYGCPDLGRYSDVNLYIFPQLYPFKNARPAFTIL
jgi:hypothetical protein